MNLDSLSFALSQISYSVANLTKKNFKSSVTEISHLIAQHGAEADRHLFRCLFSHVEFSGDGHPGKDFHQTQYLTQECSSLIRKANFVSTLCYAIDNPLHHQKSLRPGPNLLNQLSKILRLTKLQEVAFGLALLSSTKQDTRQGASQFLKLRLNGLLVSYSSAESSSTVEEIQEAPAELLHLLLSSVLSEKDFGVTQETKETFFTKLREYFSRDKVSAVVRPLLYPSTEDLVPEQLNPDALATPTGIMATSLADTLREIGYIFTSTLEECRNTLMSLGVREITPPSIARVLGMMAKSPAGITDSISVQALGASNNQWLDNKDGTPDGAPLSWNVDIFVQAIKDLAPHLNWRDVVAELDHQGFQISSKQGLRLIVQALSKALTDVFPIDLIYRQWKNTEGQLSWMTTSIKNPDVFCFADFRFHTVNLEQLKTPPDEENRDVATWKSLDLVETLIRLSESGHYQPVSELFKFPVQHCPDLLVFALLQIPQWNRMKHELLQTLIPVFLGNHPNSGQVLAYAWHVSGQSTTVRTLIMHSMAEWYMRGDMHDQTRLSRILDVAQDLKALSMLLKATPFAFVIDLACLASRREYLKLEKWLNDKIIEHQEPFLKEIALYLKRRCPQLLPGTQNKEDPSKVVPLPPETRHDLLQKLQQYHANVVSPELQEMIVTILQNANTILKRPAPAVAPVAIPAAKQGGITAGALPGLTTPTPQAANPIDQMSGLGPIGASAAAPTVPTNPGLPTSLATSLPGASGSPAKIFPTLNPSTPGFGHPSTMNLASQLQNLNMQTTMTSSTPTKAPNPNPNPLPGLGGGGGLGGLGPNATGGLGGLGPSAAGGLGGLGPGQGNQFNPQPQQPQRGNPQQTAQERLRSENFGLGGPGPNPGNNPTSAGVGGDLSIPAVSQQFPREIEDEANSYFQKIYTHVDSAGTPGISIDEVLDMLKKFKYSQQKREQEVFYCMLRNLFDEYRFFPHYPEKELHTTAVLYGGIIEQGLVTYMDLGIALRYVLEALKKQHGSKMYYFGIAALDRFKTRLKDYPQYCQHLASIAHFTQFPQHMKEYCEYGARSQEPPNRPMGTVQSPGPLGLLAQPAVSTATVTTAVATTTTTTTTTASHGAIERPNRPKPSIATATNIDTLIAGQEDLLVPPETLQDKVFFIFNNLSIANMEVKGKELREQIEDKYMPWTAQYMVMKRASIEANFHTLYAKLLDTLASIELLTMVISETFRNIRVLLRSDKGVSNFSDRSLLKNLGHWLGMLTLAKNKPILHDDIDLKSLLYEAHHKGPQELLYVVPFVAKVMESCANSKVFKPHNPWTMGIMNVLAELHQEPDLKLNLKFEIEVLCKNLNIDINDLHPGQYLQDTERKLTMEHQLSAPRKQPDSCTPQPDDPLQINMPTPTTTVIASTPTQVGSTVVSGPRSAASASPAPQQQAPPATVTTSTTSMVMPQPQYGYHEINVMSLAGLAPHLNINEQLPILQAHPQLKQLVRPAVERSVRELLPPVVERSIKIALTTCEQIVKKDFALDPEESRMRAAAHHMVRFMTSGMALITCREPLLLNISNNIKTAFLNTLRTATPPQKEAIEQAAQVLAQDSVDLACAFIQKTAVEKAIPEMDNRLTTDYELRKHARSEGRRYCDPVILTYQAERMPEQIRLKVGGVTHQQIAVYEEFARNIPGFASTKQEVLPASAAYMNRAQQPPATNTTMAALPGGGAGDDITQIYDKVAHDIEANLRLAMNTPNNPQVQTLHNLLEAVIQARATREIGSALALLQKAVEGLQEGMTAIPADPQFTVRYRDCHLLVLKGLQDHRAYGPQWTNKQVTRALIECREEYKYNIEAVDCLVRAQMVNMQQYDMHLAQCMDNGHNYMAVAFAMQLVQRFCVDAADKIGPSQETLFQADFFNTIETLSSVARLSRPCPEGLQQLVDTIRQQSDGGLLDRVAGGPASMMHSGISQAREFDDPPGLHDKTEYLLKEWVQMYHSPAAGRDSAKAFSAFVAQMHQHGILKTDELITRFFRLCTEMCVDLCYRALAETVQHTVRTKCFYTLDAFVRLVALLVKHSGDTANTVTKINLLNKVLGIVAGVLLQDHEVRHTEFQQMPYHRFFIMLFIELNAPEHVLENINYQVLTAFCNTLHILRPAKAPGFAYAWLELISHRVFIGRMLAITPQQRGWSMYAQLLIDLFKFMAPFLRNSELTKPTLLLYKGTLRVLLVLLHDFPEFLCDYHYAFCDVIPPNCIQMRNLVLSAFPRNMRLPDPFMRSLKVDMLPEIAHPPRIMTPFQNNIQPAHFKKDLESYLKTRSPVTFLSELRSNLQVSSEPGMRYNMPLMNALVVYVGTQAIAHIHAKGQTPSMSTIAHASHMDIFQNLAIDLDTEGRYLFLNAIASQLRYPNSHTHYFSCTLLYLFAEANNEAIQEQITRVLLERLIANRPHPWGLLITFIELIKNPNFKFWNHEFVHCAPEIEKLFESVAKSCIPLRQQAQTPQQGMREEVQ